MQQVPTTHTSPATALDIEQVDRAVDAAIHAGEAGSLRVLGYGEITLVVGWPRERPELAVKRLPPFRDRRQLDSYKELLERYIAALRDRGVEVVPTEVRAVDAGRGGLHAYLIQTLVPRERRLNVRPAWGAAAGGRRSARQPGRARRRWSSTRSSDSMPRPRTGPSRTAGLPVSTYPPL